MNRISLVCAGVLACACTVVNADTIYSTGFESNLGNWDAFGGGYDATRVASGTNGITSAAGGWHAVSSAAGSASRWGGYNFGAGDAVPTAFQEYTTSVAIYLNVGGGAANDTRFDFSSAINDSSGNHRRDFIFNAGFYDSSDMTGPGSGTNRFVISASNNAPGWPQNPGRDPVAISNTGWYTFEHHFYDNSGFLAVDMSIRDASNSLINTWTLSTPLDSIGGIGGNRYGWFAVNEFDTLAFDNASLTLTSVPLPTTAGLAAAGMFGLVGIRRRRSVR